MKRMSTHFITAALVSHIFYSAICFAAHKPFRVVIDPGHGGGDHGTIYDSGTEQIAEKDVTLLLSFMIARELKALGMDVRLTRKDDHEIPLGDRTQLANQLQADLFLSVHMNSTPTKHAQTASGVETYFLNTTSDASSRRLAHLENTVISHAGIKTPEQADVALILRDLRLDANLSESKRLACTIQDRLGTQRHSRGVKQALFHVLLGAEMPSALLEAGFLNNAKDRNWVLSQNGRKTLATSIAQAVNQFRIQKNTSVAEHVLSHCMVQR